MKLKRIVGGNLESNCYILYQKEGSNCLIVDPGYQPKKYIRFLEGMKLVPAAVILTHLHHDHTGAADAVSDYFDCPVYMHEDDAFIYKGRVDHRMTHGFTFDLDGEILQVLHTPGHTKGSICLYSGKSKICLTGDTIFDTDLGRTDLEGGSEEDMKQSICQVVDLWDNQITIYPGHDNHCTMKFVRDFNKEFIALRDGHERERV